MRPGHIATEFSEIGNKMSGDILSETDTDFKSVYQRACAATGKLFDGLSIPGPEVIADLIIKAVLSDNPEPVYSEGPFTDTILESRFKLKDNEFHEYLLEKVDLK